MKRSTMRSICAILGAGYSHVIGAPLTRDLFGTRDIAISSAASAHRFQTVWSDYDAWLSENPSGNPEEYLGDLLRRCQSTAWRATGRYALDESAPTAGTQVQGPALSFPDLPLPDRMIPQFNWAVELLGAVLSTPLPTDTTTTNFRYGARVIFPLRCYPHGAFWAELKSKAHHVAAVTTNYDIFIERVLRHRQMNRVFGPGCYYGGIRKPQLLRGTQLPWAYSGNHIEMDGAVPIYKLHGSLNWSRTKDGIELFQDLRPAFRRGGNAAIIPPMREKEVPAWLRPVWTSAERELARATVWVVCGYSLPPYDQAIAQLLSRAAAAGNLERIFVLDPNASELGHRYSVIAQNLQVVPLKGLPEGIRQLRELL